MSAQTSMLHIRVDDDINDQATQALTAMGLTIKVPNAETQAAMAESRMMLADLEKCSRL